MSKRIARLAVVLAALSVMAVAPAASAHAEICVLCYPHTD